MSIHKSNNLEYNKMQLTILTFTVLQTTANTPAQLTIISANQAGESVAERRSSINNELIILIISINPSVSMNHSINMVQILHHL